MKSPQRTSPSGPIDMEAELNTKKTNNPTSGSDATMPLIKTRSIDTADGAVIYPWQGNQYEFMKFDGMVEIALLADAGDDWNGSVFSGSDVLMQNSPLDALAVASPIIYPDHFTLSDVAAYAERLGCELTNVNGAVADSRTMVRITPV